MGDEDDGSGLGPGGVALESSSASAVLPTQREQQPPHPELEEQQQEEEAPQPPPYSASSAAAAFQNRLGWRIESCSVGRGRKRKAILRDIGALGRPWLLTRLFRICYAAYPNPFNL